MMAPKGIADLKKIFSGTRFEKLKKCILSDLR
jgi:hypothetical protein